MKVFYLVAFLLIAQYGLAQAPNLFPNDKFLTVNLHANFPLATMQKFCNVGWGGSIKYNQQVARHIHATGAVAMVNYPTKNSTDLFLDQYETTSGIVFSLIGVKIGFRYDKSKIFIEPNIGYSFGLYQSTQFSDITGLTFGGRIGYTISKHFEVATEFESVILNSTSLSTLGLRVGYNFWFNKKQKRK